MLSSWPQVGFAGSCWSTCRHWVATRRRVNVEALSGRDRVLGSIMGSFLLWQQTAHLIEDEPRRALGVQSVDGIHELGVGAHQDAVAVVLDAIEDDPRGLVGSQHLDRRCLS